MKVTLLIATLLFSLSSFAFKGQYKSISFMDGLSRKLATVDEINSSDFKISKIDVYENQGPISSDWICTFNVEPINAVNITITNGETYSFDGEKVVRIHHETRIEADEACKKDINEIFSEWVTYKKYPTYFEF